MKAFCNGNPRTSKRKITSKCVAVGEGLLSQCEWVRGSAAGAVFDSQASRGGGSMQVGNSKSDGQHGLQSVCSWSEVTSQITWSPPISSFILVPSILPPPPEVKKCLGAVGSTMPLSC